MFRRLIGSLGEGHLAALLLFAAVGFNLYALYPEVAIKVPSLNDNALHIQAVERALTAILMWQDPTDHWMAAASSFGYPLFHHYQNLPHVVTAAVYLPLAVVTRGALSLTDWFDWLRYFLLALFPLSLYWSMRRIGFEQFVSAVAALLSSLVATNGLLGLEYGSYLWRGGGVYTQMWGMLLLPPALAMSWVYLRDGRGYFWSVLLVVATVLCHLLSGYILAGSIIGSTLFALPGMAWRLRITRLAFLGIPAAVIAAYFLLPLLLDSTYQTHSLFEPQWHYDSMGAAWTLNALLHGELFDFGRFPALTILAAIGFAVCVWNWREARYRIPIVLFVLWLLVFFGRPTRGALLDVLPLAREVNYQRMISGIHLAGIMLAGIGLAMLWTRAWSYRDKRLLITPALATLVLLMPVYQERLGFMAGDARLMSETRGALDAEEPNIQRLIETLSELPPGRVYAGLPGTWGANYKFGSVPMYDVIYAAGLDMLAYPFASFSHNSNLAWGFADGKQEQYNTDYAKLALSH